jgi:hypothetical protein
MTRGINRARVRRRVAAWLGGSCKRACVGYVHDGRRPSSRRQGGGGGWEEEIGRARRGSLTPGLYEVRDASLLHEAGRDKGLDSSGFHFVSSAIYTFYARSGSRNSHGYQSRNEM